MRRPSSHLTSSNRLPSIYTEKKEDPIASGISAEQMQSLADFMKEQGDKAKAWRDGRISQSDLDDKNRLPHEWKFVQNRYDSTKQYRLVTTKIDKRITEDITAKLHQISGAEDIPIVHGSLSDLKMKNAIREIREMGKDATYWLIDPLDSVNAFINPNQTDYCTKLALIKGGKPVEGIIYYPEIKTLLYTKDGQAWIRRGDDVSLAQLPKTEQVVGSAETPLRVTHRLVRHNDAHHPLHQTLSKLKRAGVHCKHETMRFLDKDRPEREHGNLWESDPMIGSSNLRFPEELAVLEGMAHMGARTSEHEWTRAPDEAFFTAAGGQYAYVGRGRPHEYGSQNDFLIGTNALVTTPDVLKALKERSPYAALSSKQAEQPRQR